MQSVVMLCHLCWVSFMLSVTYNPFMLSVVKLYVVMLSVLPPGAQAYPSGAPYRTPL
jgi:hypothetical protein